MLDAAAPKVYPLACDRFRERWWQRVFLLAPCEFREEANGRFEQRHAVRTAAELLE
jgi:hypothetical protein